MFRNFAKPLETFLQLIVLGGIFLIPLVWSRYLNANYVSAKFFLLYFIAAFSLFVSSKAITLPVLPRILMFSLLGLGVLHFVSPLVSGQWVHILYMFKFLSFLFLAYYFYGLKMDIEVVLKRFDGLFLLTGLGIFALAGYDFYNLRIAQLDIASGFLLGSFGNVNMLAEFLILSLPLVHLWGQTRTKTPQVLKDILFWGWLFFIFYCRSRSAWMGLGLWAIWGLTQKKISWKEVGLLGLAFVSYQLAIHLPHIENIETNVKSDSFSQRLHLYITTLKLIADHPFGVGVGQYFNQIMPYLVNSDFKPAEYVYFDQPHSEFLKWAVQFGILGFVLPFLVLGYLVWFAFKEKNFFLCGSFLVLLPQLAFQFPFENPTSLLYLAFLFALALRLFPQRVDLTLIWWKRIPLILLGLIGIFHATLFVTSIFFETSHNNNLSYVESACELYPVNMNGCFVRDQFLINTNQMGPVKRALIEDIEKFPYHAGIMRILPAYLRVTQDNQKICEAVLIYDYIYAKQTFFNAEIMQACARYQVPVIHHSPEQFNNDYIKWLRGVVY